MSDEWVQTISGRYIELYERLTGQTFRPAPISNEEIVERVEAAIQRLEQA